MICDHEPPHFLQVGHLSSNHLFKDLSNGDQLFLTQMREIFALSWTGFTKMSQRLPKISENFPKTFECCRKRPKMFRRTLTTSEAI